MTDGLLSDALLLHVRKLAEEIGPRPAGHPAEMRARQYIRQVLGALGYRGVCLSGFGPDGWLQNWHQTSDNVENLVPAGLEKAARFAWAMMQDLDEGNIKLSQSAGATLSPRARKSLPAKGESRLSAAASASL